MFTGDLHMIFDIKMDGQFTRTGSSIGEIKEEMCARLHTASAADGKMAFHKVYPDLYPDEPLLDGGDDDLEYPLTFSDTWKRDFMKRHNFSFRKVGKRMNKRGVTENVVACAYNT
jgi:hypothetical protein